ncbi:hypothetical protein EIP86_010610 [Pleurotus ostreatoroseus]|nr:hypothetical protein EIP86_010610 [Pleurotus ostreatoroseus]
MHADPAPDRATPQSSDADIDDYQTRRMSSSAASDDSLQSRPDKRAFDFSPSASPAPKKSRPEDALDAAWDSPQHNEHDPQGSPRVQLPSLAAAFSDRHELRRNSLPTLLASDNNRLRLPAPAHHRPSPSSSSSLGLSSYQFPAADPADDRRPRLAADTQLGLYNADYSLPSTALSSSSSFSLPTDAEPLDDPWASGIVRPSSTPSQIPAHDDALRHSLSHQGLYAGVTRISGHAPADRTSRTSLSGPAVKSENDWSFAGADFASLANTQGPAMSSPSIAVSGSPQRSPQAAAPVLSTLVDRPPRKRGKLPKPVTDFLKDWLHRHSDHPYPSEEEKKALCHATGLSMSQVSNWMINARRRILAPAAVRGAGPTTNNPYNTPAGRSVLDARRASVAGGEPMSLYYPMSLQSLPDGLSTRQMVSMTRSMSSSHATAGSLAHAHSHGHHPYSLEGSSYSRLSYGGGSGSGSTGSGGGALHPSQHAGSAGSSYLGVPLSAPASLPTPNPFLGGPAHSHPQGLYAQQGGGGYGGRGMTPDGGAQGQRYTFPDAHAHSVSPQPGSGYNTPH